MRFTRLFTAILLSSALLSTARADDAKDWAADPIWHDGLVEKAVYDASRIVYGKPRSFEAIVFTNKEQHDVKTKTKSDKSTDTVEVWKHNQIEVIPTPNYDYKYEATTHLTVDGLKLWRLDVASQEFCGTSFKQFELKGSPGDKPSWDYWSFSYMPESGRVAGTIDAQNQPVVPFNSLPLYLRNFDFAGKGSVSFQMLPDQKSNRATAFKPVAAEVRYEGKHDGGHQLDLFVDGKPYGSYVFADDRQHVMLSYNGVDGLKYTLKSQDRVNYWTIKGE